MVSQSDTWNPSQYNRFRTERMQPFFDLFALIQPRPGMRVIDLGCGTGELTAMLAERLPDAEVEGVDASAAMLEQALPRAHARLRFRRADMTTITDFRSYDLVFSNAALQWVPDHERLLVQILRQLRPGAQIAMQVPGGGDVPTRGLAAAVAQTPAFRDRIVPPAPRGGALSLARYSQLLYDHGLRTQVCYEKIYGHEMAHTGEVIAFLQGTGLREYLVQLDATGQAAFLDACRTRLIAAVGDRSPYLYQMHRRLFWGQSRE